MVDEIDYMKYLQDNDDESAEDRMENIDELIAKAVFFQENHEEATLTGFLEDVALVADIDTVDSKEEKVLLMTIHSAKGLEFPFVYMAGMEDGLFPSYMSIASYDPTDLEEERRLAYVGITRAMNDLTLTYARMRMIRGENQYNPISRFVREIPEDTLDDKVRTGKRPVEEQDFFAEIAGMQEGLKVGRTNTDFRPKAILRPRVTAKADQPFIAKGIGSLNQLAGISKGAAVQLSGELDYAVGDRVRHIKYGEGTVKGITKEPRDYKVTVNFDTAGQKIMYASFAKLKRL